MELSLEWPCCYETHLVRFFYLRSFQLCLGTCNPNYVIDCFYIHLFFWSTRKRSSRSYKHAKFPLLGWTVIGPESHCKIDDPMESWNCISPIHIQFHIHSTSLCWISEPSCLTGYWTYTLNNFFLAYWVLFFKPQAFPGVTTTVKTKFMGKDTLAYIFLLIKMNM